MTNANGITPTAEKAYRFDFWSKRKVFFAISIVLIVIGLVFNIIFGTKFDMKFVGGAMIKYEVTGGEADGNEVAAIINEETSRDATVLVNESITSGNQQVTVNFAGNEGLSIEEQKSIGATLTEKYDELTFEVLESSSVDPTMGVRFLQKCAVTVAITFLLLLIYIAIRFSRIGGISAGVTSIIALIHDIAITYFVFVIFGMPIDDIFMAVILTILGYSLNDTIVIYDRIRENRRLSGSKGELSEVMNLSLNQTMGRSILTSVTTFMALLIVFIVASIYDMTTVTTFALPMMFGIVAGAYSSLFISAPLWTMWQKRKSKRGKKSSGKALKSKPLIK